MSSQAGKRYPSYNKYHRELRARRDAELDSVRAGKEHPAIPSTESRAYRAPALTIRSDFSRHTFHVVQIDATEMPAFYHKEDYCTFYAVRNFDADGIVMMYLGKGDSGAPRQIVAWYPKGAFWSSYGTTLKGAIEGAQKDGWLYA